MTDLLYVWIPFMIGFALGFWAHAIWMDRYMDDSARLVGEARAERDRYKAVYEMTAPEGIATAQPSAETLAQTSQPPVAAFKSFVSPPDEHIGILARAWLESAAEAEESGEPPDGNWNEAALDALLFARHILAAQTETGK